uniref:Uncharacterized protein n=1 Tax=Oryza sativa subsp. japonica TaxID=39947 RepID=Q6Z986_ORYSJ|nr:hypothetical protein [Oryza sativa Japonica Group]BAD03379.1 hypothetical protein [Oryza sativa Japonica Group]
MRAEQKKERETAKASSRTKTTPKSIAPKTSQNPPPRTPTAVSAAQMGEQTAAEASEAGITGGEGMDGGGRAYPD